MFRILIIVDDDFAAKKLWNRISEIEPAFSLAGNANNVKTAIDFLKTNSPPDLIISQLNLSDGKSFDIITQTGSHIPFVFITHHNRYAQSFFTSHGITAIQNPLKKADLQVVVQKFRAGDISPGMHSIADVIQLFDPPKKTYKKRFVVKMSDRINTVAIEKIAYFYTEQKDNYLVSIDGRIYDIDYHLDALEAMLDPDNFFRINRQFIISIKAVADTVDYSKNRIELSLKPACKHETIVSAARVTDFNKWLSGNNT